jgi:prepilin-type N-terminal cleavage/methylation domain-containing protein
LPEIESVLRSAALQAKKEWKFMTRKQQAGFTLIEMMISLIVLLAVSGIVMSGMVQMMKTQGTIANRTELHTSVRGATELLQQEIGQAGKISLPTPPPPEGWAMLPPGVPATAFVSPDVPATVSVSFNVVSPTNGLPVLFEGEWITVDTGLNKETVQLTCPAGKGLCPFTSNTWNATFYFTHIPTTLLPTTVLGVPISVPGAFSTGIVPPQLGPWLPNVPAGYGGYPNGSTGTVLKLYGDINGDGNMIYVEYTCDWQNTVGNGAMLYRNQMDFDAAAKNPITASMALLTNLDPKGNPADQTGNPVPCFTYQVLTKDGPFAVTNDMVFVTDVAVTLTVDTQNTDAVTHAVQVETKALLNVSPRNVYQAYEFSQFDYVNRVQLTPSVTKANLFY